MNKVPHFFKCVCCMLKRGGFLLPNHACHADAVDITGDVSPLPPSSTYVKEKACVYKKVKTFYKWAALIYRKLISTCFILIVFEVWPTASVYNCVRERLSTYLCGGRWVDSASLGFI